MKNVRWVIQENLIKENDLRQMEACLERLRVSYEHVTVIPFSEKLPKFTLDGMTNIYYGSTTFMNSVYRELRPEGLFFNEEFTMQNYLNRYGKHMLSSEGEVLAFGEFMGRSNDASEKFFIRPNEDSKSFNGEVRNFGEIASWFEGLKTMYDNVIINEDTKILVCEPYNIRKEWRNYIVGGKVVTSSLYRKDFRLCKSRKDVPEDMIAFAQARADEYLPHRNVAMDIGLCGGEYYIIELGCLNSVGFYDCDIDKLVEAITRDIHGRRGT